METTVWLLTLIFVGVILNVARYMYAARIQPKKILIKETMVGEDADDDKVNDISGNGVSDDEISDDEVSDDEVIDDDEILNDENAGEICDDKTINDEIYEDDKDDISNVLIRHTIKLYEPWYSWIKSGKATVICARGTLSTFGEYVNSGVMIMNGSTDTMDERIKVKVTSVNYYYTLSECIEKEGHTNISPDVKSTDECHNLYLGVTSKGKQLYSDTLIKAFGGICALKIEQLT